MMHNNGFTFFPIAYHLLHILLTRCLLAAIQMIVVWWDLTNNFEKMRNKVYKEKMASTS